MPTYFEKYGHTLITLAAIIAAFVGLVTINGNRLDAQDRLISQLFVAVNQRLDAQDRLISQHFAAVNQRLDAQDKRLDGQDQRIDGLEAGMNQRIDGLEAGMNQRIDGLEAGMNQRLDRLIDEVAELRRLTVGISERVSRNEGEIDVIREQLRIADTPSP